MESEPSGPPPVVLFGSDADLLDETRALLEADGAEVRLCRRSGALPGALRDSPVVVHLGGGPLAPFPSTHESANVTSMRKLCEAAGRAPVRRIVFVSARGADATSANGYLRAKGRAEEILTGSAVPWIVLRATHVIGDPRRPGPVARALLAVHAGRVAVLGTGRQRVTPIARRDLARAVVNAALAADAPTGIFELAGPRTLTMDGLVDLLHHGDVPKRHLGGRATRVQAYVSPQLSPALAELLEADDVADGTPAAVVLGVPLTPLETAWTATATPTGARAPVRTRRVPRPAAPRTGLRA